MLLTSFAATRASVSSNIAAAAGGAGLFTNVWGLLAAQLAALGFAVWQYTRNNAPPAEPSA